MILTEKEQLALKKAKKLKVFRIRNTENEKTFADIYHHIQQEVNKKEGNQLTRSSLQSANTWLSRFSKLVYRLNNQ